VWVVMGRFSVGGDGEVQCGWVWGGSVWVVMGRFSVGGDGEVQCG
jgi:hypothetical protein